MKSLIDTSGGVERLTVTIIMLLLFESVSITKVI